MYAFLNKCVKICGTKFGSFVSKFYELEKLLKYTRKQVTGKNMAKHKNPSFNHHTIHKIIRDKISISPA